MAPSASANPIRVVVADDAYVIREGLGAVLGRVPDVELVAVCSDGKELNEAVADTRPDVVITDVRMPPGGDGEGVRIAVRLRESEPQMGVILLTQYVEAAYAISLVRHGTSHCAYLLKERIRDRDELLRAIREVASGGSVIDPRVVEVLIESRSQAENSPLSELTPREREILAQIAEGKSNAAIAESLVLTKRAVEKHVNSIFAKLDLPGPETVSRRVKAALLFLADADHRDG